MAAMTLQVLQDREGYFFIANEEGHDVVGNTYRNRVTAECRLNQILDDDYCDEQAQAGIRVKVDPVRGTAWTAIRDDEYDGPGSPVGWGTSPQQAVADLIEQEEERA